MLSKFILLLGWISLALGGQSPLNVLNEETGDFGGAPFPLRNQMDTFIEVDLNGDVISYGFYLPRLANMGINTTIPNPSGIPLGAALDFHKKDLKDPSQVPWEFIGINYNPAGHPPSEYLIPHFDIHVWLEPSEFSRGIECNGTSFPPCQSTPWLAARFNDTPSQDYYPVNSTNNPDEWVPTMGAHLVPQVPPDDFETVPAAIIGSYLGKVIFHEPMISSNIFLESENGTLNFPWPILKYPTPGRYFTNVRIEYESIEERYKVTFNNLVVSPEENRGTPIFIGIPAILSGSRIFGSAVSPSKDCLINDGKIVDGGYLVKSDGEEYCCRSRGTFDGFTCDNLSCGVPKPLVPESPDSYFFNPVSTKCYARCSERVPIIS